MTGLRSERIETVVFSTESCTSTLSLSDVAVLGAGSTPFALSHSGSTSTFTVGGEELTTYTTAYGLEGTEMVSDGYFHESEVRSAPYFDIIIDGINAVVEE